MGNIKQTDKSAKGLKLVSMWLSQDDQWLYYSEIKKEAVRMGFSKSTVSRYLTELVKQDVLEVKLEREGLPKSRKRLFRPKKEYWAKNFQWIPISPEASDAEHLLLSGFVSEITNKFIETSRHAIKVAPKPSVIRALSRAKRNKLDAKITQLLSATRLDIARIARHYYNKENKQEANYELLRSSVLKVVTAYLDLWDFVMTTNGAQEEFGARMENLQKSLKTLK